MVGGEAGFQPGQPVAVVEHLEVGVGERLDLGLGDGADRRPLLGGGEAQTLLEALTDCVVARGTTEDEVDRGQHRLVTQPFDHLAPTRGVQTPAPAAAEPR